MPKVKVKNIESHGFVGNKDFCLPPSCSKELAEKILGAKLVMLNDGRHVFNFEIPDEFNRAVLIS